MSRPFRILPRIGPLNRPFWTGGAEGELRLLRCRACRHWIHPPAPLCPACLAREPEVVAASGRGRVLSFTVNHQPWLPGLDPPYVIAIVELEEQAGLRLTTRMVGCAPGEVSIGQAVRVVFEVCDEGVFLPLFEPAA